MTEYTLDHVEARCTELTDTLETEGVRRTVQRYVQRQLKNVSLHSSTTHALAMVDDGIYEIGTYLPHLVALARGRVEFVLYQGEGEEPLLQKVRALTSDVTLLDEGLRPSDGAVLYGSSVLLKLRSEGWQKLCLGFSGDGSAKSRFMQAGAQGTVFKGIDPAGTIPELAKTLQAVRPSS